MHTKNINLIVGGSTGIGRVIFDLFSKKNKNTYILCNTNTNLNLNMVDNKGIKSPGM